MLAKRIIPCLDVRDGRLTKGVKFAGNEDIGDPVATARRYYEEGADEIVFYDITASAEGRGIFLRNRVRHGNHGPVPGISGHVREGTLRSQGEKRADRQFFSAGFRRGPVPLCL